MALVSGARIIFIDSGGIQEATTAMGIPCLTLHENTERPVTITLGINRVVGCSPLKIIKEASRALSSTPSPSPSAVPLRQKSPRANCAGVWYDLGALTLLPSP